MSGFIGPIRIALAFLLASCTTPQTGPTGERTGTPPQEIAQCQTQPHLPWCH